MSELKKIRVQHVTRGDDGLEVKTDVDVLTDASAVTMDGKDLKSGIGGMIDDRIGELIDGAPQELDTLKEIADELSKNQSGVTTILKKLGDKVDKDGNKVLSSNDFTNAQKTKLDGIEEGAQKNVVTSVNGQTGDVTLAISNVDQDIVPTVLYTNQFFAGIGGEESADTPPSVSDKVVGPANFVKNDERFRLCKIIYCGDDYAYDNIDELKLFVARVLGEYKKALFIVSPSFNMTRYSTVNLKLCDYVQSVLRIETVTGMHADMYEQIKADMPFNYYNHLDVISTNISAVGMKDAMPKILQIGEKKYRNQQLTDEEKTWLLNK